VVDESQQESKEYVGGGTQCPAEAICSSYTPSSRSWTGMIVRFGKYGDVSFKWEWPRDGDGDELMSQRIMAMSGG